MDKRIWAVYFSATGTTEKMVCRTADRLASGGGSGEERTAKRYDFTLPAARREPASFTSEDLVVFGVPVYAGRVPNVLLKYLDTLEGGGAMAVPMVLYGNRNFDDGLIELRNILEDHGFHTVAAAAFIGEHSFSTTLAAGRPDQQDLELADRFADGVRARLDQAEREGTLSALLEMPVEVLGETPLRGYYQPRDRKGNPVDIRKVKPKTSEACTNCGICAEVCPMGSISPEDVREFVGICIKCGACIKKCPEHAKYYDDEGYLYHKKELELGLERRAEPELFYI